MRHPNDPFRTRGGHQIAAGRFRAGGAGGPGADGMIVHELVTNAGKYGSLSVPGGYLDIAWRDQGGPIEFSWREHGGPAVVEPKPRRGFGLRLVERETMGLGGKADLKFDPGGVRVDLRFPN